MTPSTVADLIDAQAAARPDSIYFIATETGRTLTFGQLRESCASISRFLADRGPAPGAHISLVMPNGLATLRILLGAMWGGYCVNPVNLLSQPEQMRYVLDHSDCAIVFTSPEWTGKVRELVKDMARKVEVVEVDPDAERLVGESGPGPSLPCSVRDDTLALLMYTSGTT